MAGLLGYTKSGFVVKTILAVDLAFFCSPESLALSQEPVVSTYQQGGRTGLILNFPGVRKPERRCPLFSLQSLQS